MNCAEANQLDLVDYLNSIGFQAKKVRGNDHWYCSPFREEKENSFKINRSKNVWYDHGAGKGGGVIDFIIEFYKCDVSDALQKLSSFHLQKFVKNNYQRPLFHLHENSLLNHRDATETGIRIIAAKQPIDDPILCRYIRQRRIEKSIADTYSYEVHFTAGEKEKIYKAVGFKNNAGGYELRNEYFKGSSSPKYISYFNNKSKNLAVFEGFFDFLSYQTILQNKEHQLSNFLILNSLSFFERSLLLMEKHERIHLYLDHDNAGRKWTEMALQRSRKFKDESALYAGYKDLNDWVMNFGNLLVKKELKKSPGRHL
ncbi:MAG: toprim domain-containing protein [Ginsengibacter sp.]